VGGTGQHGNLGIELVDLGLLSIGPAYDREQGGRVDDGTSLTVNTLDGIADSEEVVRFELSAHGSAD
jgi:hypothetical protein